MSPKFSGFLCNNFTIRLLVFDYKTYLLLTDKCIFILLNENKKEQVDEMCKLYVLMFVKGCVR
jgi:hypothetical protein